MAVIFENLWWDLVALTATLLFYTFFYFKHAHSYWRRRDVPTLRPTFPFGNAKRVMLRKQHAGHMLKYAYDHFKPKGHRFCGLYFFSRKAFMPLDPELIKRVLSTDFQYFHDRGIYHDEVNDPLGASLFALEGTKWKKLRAKLTPTFTSGKLKNMFQTFLACGHQLLETVDKTLLQCDEKEENSMEMKDLMSRYSTDVIGSCAFGIECNSFKNPTSEFRTAGIRVFQPNLQDSVKMIVTRGFPGLSRLFKLKVIPKHVTEFFMGVIKDTITYRLKNNVTRNDFLQLLMQLGNFKLSDVDGDGDNSSTKQDNNSEFITMNEAAAAGFAFFAAGFETSASAMSFALYELALHPEIQDRARQDVIQSLKKHEDVISYDSLMEMHYLDQVVYETLRKYPAAQLILRKCTKRYRIPDTDVFIEEGTSTLIPVLGLHGDPEFFPDPEQFDPDRFNKENKSKRHDYAFLPFGEGPRICIGIRFGMMQTKLGIALLLKNYQFSINEKTSVPLKMNTTGIMIAPVEGIWLNVTKI